MFDEFGNFDSAEEINKKAEDLMEKGDAEAVIRLAKENGLGEAAELYTSGDLELLADPQEAAVGKIEIERQETVLEGVLEDWISYIEAECMESEEMAIAVRRKSKSLTQCIAYLLLESMTGAKTVDRPIITEVKRIAKEKGIDLKKTCGIEERWLQYTKLGFPGSRKVKELIRNYYLTENWEA